MEYPFPPNVHLPQVPIRPSAHICKHLRKMGIGHLGNLFRELGVSLSPNVHLSQVPICPSAHLHTFGGNGHRVLGVPLFPKCPFAPSAHLPQCPFVNIWGKWTPSTWGTPFPQMSICLGACLHQCPFPRCPIPPNIYFPQIPISPDTHLPQIFISPVPICFKPL